jgi:hypothetical protein
MLRLLLSRWWVLIEGGSHRDQVSLPYAVADTGVGIYPVLPKGSSARSDERFALIHHGEEAFAAAVSRLLEPGPASTRDIDQVARSTDAVSVQEPVLEGAVR